MDWPIEVVEWYDSESIDPWTNVDDLNSDGPAIITIGFVVKENDRMLVVSPNWDSKNRNVSCVMMIPKCCIKKRREIKWDGQGKRKRTR